MKFVGLATLALAGSALCFGASKEIIELSRDVSLLQDKVNTIQRTLDEKLPTIQTLQQQQTESTIKTQAQMSNIQTDVTTAVGRGLGPVSNLNERVNAVGEDVKALRDTLSDLSARLERIDAKITDLKNQSLQQNPPPAPGTAPNGQAPTQGQPGTTAVPPGMSAEKSYTDARRDLQTGNIDLAGKEFQDYLTYFPSTEQAPNAQYYIGQIAYQKGDYAGSIRAFDAVLERYPENPKTADAHLMKGQALLKSNQRSLAANEFRELIAKYPRTDDARQAQYLLRQMGLSNASAPRRKS